MANPYSPRTTDQLYGFWVGFKAYEPGARLGGTYALKEGFHSSVEDNLERWPSNYSIRDAINRRDPRTVARAIDLTLSSTLMKRYTSRLRAAALANDPRMAPVREFYGTLNGTSVYGLAHTGPDTDWRTSSADATHLWHIHLSFFTPYVDDAAALSGVLSVLKGESLADYLGGTIMEQNLPRHGDKGTWVGFFQRLVIDRGATLPKYGPDNAYGDEFASALRWWWKNIVKSTSAYDGRVITSDVARHLMGLERPAPAPVAPTQAQVDAAVAKFLTANPIKVPTGVTVDLGTVNGTLTGG